MTLQAPPRRMFTGAAEVAIELFLNNDTQTAGQLPHAFSSLKRAVGLRITPSLTRWVFLCLLAGFAGAGFGQVAYRLPTSNKRRKTALPI
ncbi:hypothetical protein [Rhodoferax sp.]|uniref:hypothetical protein n=1 Tax=Rhodoferax sp. TaxID=50421 RepID=UPI0025DD920C|nr:hypothetical protein [Rhodoferax sp.]